MNKICFLLVCTVLPCFAAPLQWQNSKYTKLVEHEGKTYLEVSVPAGAPDAARANCATAELNLKNTPEGELDVAVKLNIDTLSKPRNYFHGAELLTGKRFPLERRFPVREGRRKFCVCGVCFLQGFKADISGLG